jgi:DNA-binding beta-propeller fold protein YncE
MRHFFMNVRQPRVFFGQIGAALAVAAFIGGCGDNYRPVITPENPNGPPAQPVSYAVVVSSTGTDSGIVSIIDYSGDTIMTEVPLGASPKVFTIDEFGATGYTINGDGTLSNFAITTSLQAKNISESTLSPTAQPVNLMSPSAGLWATDLNGDLVDIFSGSPESYKFSIPLGSVTSPATMPVMVTGAPLITGQREYVLSQNVPDSAPMTCNNPGNFASVATGVATPIELSSHTADPPISVGRCPVYAVESADQQRFFVMNRGDDTVTVINAENNTLDTGCPPPTGCTNQNGQTYFTHPVLPLSLNAVSATGVHPPNGTTGMTATAGPIYAEYVGATQELVVANYDGGTISVIDVSLDQYGNDSATFGTTYTIPVGNTATPNPASVTVLFDGSKAYTANQNDDSGTGNGTVTVVNLSTYTVEKTLTVVGHPRTVVNIQNSEYSKIYAAAPDSPYITIIESTPTVTDLIDTAVLLEGTAVDIRTTTQNGSTGNTHFWSRVPGYGQPCNLSAGQLGSYYGASYLSTLTLDECEEQALP